MCGKKKQLVAIYKLMNPDHPYAEDMMAFMEWAKDLLSEF